MLAAAPFSCIRTRHLILLLRHDSSYNNSLFFRPFFNTYYYFSSYTNNYNHLRRSNNIIAAAICTTNFLFENTAANSSASLLYNRHGNLTVSPLLSGSAASSSPFRGPCSIGRLLFSSSTLEDGKENSSKQNKTPSASSSSIAANSKQQVADLRILRTLASYLWMKDILEFRLRVMTALALLVGAKLLNVQVPFLFKLAVDWLTTITANATALASFTTANSTLLILFATPASVLIGYGIARSTTAVFNELRTAVFSKVSLRTIGLVSRKISMVAGILAYKYGAPFAWITSLSVFAYVFFTLSVAQEKADISDYDDAKPLKLNRGSIQFDNVHFSYVPERKILDGISFVVPEGKSMAIVGTMGSGKSAILRLLFRLFDTDFGSVYDAAQRPAIHDTIMKFPEKYSIVVGERGLKLSGGEKQRVALARAFLKAAPILLCDEATSALDSTTEADILSALKSLANNRTSIFVAHRLTTAMQCDEIIVLENGKVVERGAHEVILAKAGRYAQLWAQQNSTVDFVDSAVK